MLSSQIKMQQHDFIGVQTQVHLGIACAADEFYGFFCLVINMYVFETSVDTQLGAVRRPVGVFPDLTGRSPPEARTIEHGLQNVSRAG